MEIPSPHSHSQEYTTFFCRVCLNPWETFILNSFESESKLFCSVVEKTGLPEQGLSFENKLVP